MKNMAGIDFNQKPFVVIWEVTRACDLACFHCRAAAQPKRSRFELSTEEGIQLIDEVAKLGPRVFVFTGGDPLKRPDLYQLIAHAKQSGLEPSLTPSATPLLTRDSIVDMKLAGLSRIAVSLDGSTAELHDSLRGVPGSYDLTLRSLAYARGADLPIQINTTITRRNIDDLDNMIELLESLDIVMWSVFFLVPTGRGKQDDLVTAQEVEQVFAKLYATSRRVKFDIKTTEAMHYRRYVMQRRMAEMGRSADSMIDPATGLIDPTVLFRSAEKNSIPIGVNPGFIERAPRGVNDAKGFVFISHIGEVFPSGFLPLAAGNVRKESLSHIYRDSAVFTRLRNSSLLKGKCGMCEFRELCGGSRARAFAVTHDELASDPLCAYVPRAMRGVA